MKNFNNFINEDNNEKDTMIQTIYTILRDLESLKCDITTHIPNRVFPVIFSNVDKEYNLSYKFNNLSKSFEYSHEKIMFTLDEKGTISIEVPNKVNIFIEQIFSSSYCDKHYCTVDYGNGFRDNLENLDKNIIDAIYYYLEKKIEPLTFDEFLSGKDMGLL